MRCKKAKPQGPKLNIMEAMREDSETELRRESKFKTQEYYEMPHEIEANPDCSFTSFKPKNDTAGELTAPSSEHTDMSNNDSIMTFQNFQNGVRKHHKLTFTKKEEFDLSLDTLNSTNMIVEPLSPSYKPHKQQGDKVDDMFNKSEVGGLKPVNPFHSVGQTYKLDAVKQGLSGMLGKLSRY